VTLEEVALLAGVSRSTVSRVINNHPNVSGEVRERVWRVVQEQNYHPNNAARALASRRTGIIGLVIPQAIQSIFTDPYFSILVQGVAAACEQHEYHLMLSLITVNMELAYRRIVKGGHLDGVILASAFTHDTFFLESLQRDRFPFVLIGRQPQHEDIVSVDADNVQGSRMAARHLARAGYKRIATITGPLTMTAGVDRRDGFLSGLRDSGLPLYNGFVVEGDFSEMSGMLAMERLLALPERPDALFVASDTMAIGAMKAARAAGLSIPEEIALVGFDDIPLASVLEPSLSTVRQPIEQLGFTASTLLVDMMDYQENETAPQRVVLPTELVVRETCGHRTRFTSSRPQSEP
jgi:LacI family transcriptional regulator